MCSWYTPLNDGNADMKYFIIYLLRFGYSFMAYFHCRIRIQIRLRFQTLWLHSIMQNMFPLTQIQTPFP